MDQALTFTLINRNWLNSRFGRMDADNGYLSHEPIYGAGRGHTEGGHMRRILRLHDVIAMLRHAGVGNGDTVLDVGGAEGYLSHLMQRHLSVQATSFDLSANACTRARGLFGVDAVAGNASLLPFRSQSFDVVVMTEVVEHLVDPISAILECQRVARRLVVLSTEEWEESSADRGEKLAHREIAGHMERNVLCGEDLPVLFGNRRTLMVAQRFPQEGSELALSGHRT
ncbi:MAG TPA: class I SAM-dependent methyltransferase, partial [Planctomycetota bacterium]|nr:class I SAM-dependent methyltransferase [Planctomycetota bacterium]